MPPDSRNVEEVVSYHRKFQVLAAAFAKHDCTTAKLDDAHEAYIETIREKLASGPSIATYRSKFLKEVVDKDRARSEVDFQAFAQDVENPSMTES